MSESVKRKISAILSADVAGYSKLMEADEETTVRTVTSYRKTVSSLVEQHDGRVVDSPGDNLLSEFGSVVDAVQCAVEIQHVIEAKNAVVPEARRMEFRIGINLGDVIEEEDRIYGDGVNIASRIEGLADAGGICISSSAYEQIETKLALGYESMGDHTLKNISRTIHVYRIPMGARAAVRTESREQAPAPPDTGKGIQLDDRSADRLTIQKSRNSENCYIGGVISLACGIGVVIVGYFIERIAPVAFFPLAGGGILVGLTGISLIICGVLIGRRGETVENGDHHDESADRPAIRRPRNPERYRIGGVISLACGIGVVIVGYFIERIAPVAFFPLAGGGILVGLTGISLIICGVLIGRRG